MGGTAFNRLILLYSSLHQESSSLGFKVASDGLSCEVKGEDRCQAREQESIDGHIVGACLRGDQARPEHVEPGQCC